MLSIQEPDLRILNAGEISEKCSKSAVDVSKELQKLMLRMKGEMMAEDGSGVNYEGLKKSSLFSQYKTQAQALRKLDLTTLSEDDRKAFFINVYNALTIHGLAECDKLPSSVLNVQLFWKKTAYNIGGHVYSLDDIEHGVLRGNRPHPAAQSQPFKSDDPRIRFIMKGLDPRIHFALACGAKSCPAISVYTAENLEKALLAATCSFCEQEISVYAMQREIHVSKIFQWYHGDFGSNDVEAIRWTLPYLEETKRKSLNNLLHMLEDQGMVDLHYKEYNWSLNKI